MNGVMKMDSKQLIGEYKTGKREFCGAYLRDADLCRSDLFKVNLSNANLRGADLSGAELSFSDLSDADLRAANLFDANLYDADLRGADLRAADLRVANLSGANLHGTKRHEGVKIDTVLVSGMIGPHWMFAYRADSGEVYVEWGCETAQRTASQWLEERQTLTGKHEYDPDPCIVSMFEAWSKDPSER